MPPPDRPHPDQLFARALERPADERNAYLAQACGADAALRAEVESLLAAHERAGAFLREPALPTPRPAFAPEDDERRTEADAPLAESWIGRRIGAYRITGVLGSGGMGTVLLGERADAQFDKRVAVKVIRAGMATEDVLRRFRQERQLLARLEHPNIARLIDGGATDDGQPYLVMDYVNGVTLSAWLDQKRLALDDRLRLFCKICLPVQYAHQHLVVHRDLKPANILITADGEPRLLDFGVARMLGDPETDALEVTAPALRRLTPRYASPEQLHGRPVTTASDVYSLGVILYELLTGLHPFQADVGSRSDLERAVRTRDPTPPSAAIGHAARAAVGDAANERWPAPVEDGGARRLQRRLADELDAIVLMALRADPAERYASVGQFAEDVRRRLDGLPVLARRSTLGYRLTKFVRRHAAAVGAACLLFAVLLGATVVSTASYLRADEARRAALLAEDEAESQRAIAEQINAFLVEMLGSVNPFKAGGRDPGLLRDLLDAAAARVATEFPDRPVVEASLREVIGDTYRRLGLYDEALPHLEAARELRVRLHGADHPAALHAADSLGMLLYDRSDFEVAERLVRDALERRQNIFGAEHPDTLASLNNLGEILADRGQTQEAEQLFEAVLAGRRRVLGEEHRETLITLNNLAGARTRMRRFDEAEPLLVESLALQRRLLGDDHIDTLKGMNDLAYVRKALGRRDEAAPLYEQALAGLERVLGPGHMDTLITAHNYAVLLGELGRADEADAEFERAIERADAHLPGDHFLPGFLRGSYGRTLLRLRGPQAAEPWMIEALSRLRASLGDDHGYTRQAREALAGLYETWDRPEQAAAVRAPPD